MMSVIVDLNKVVISLQLSLFFFLFFFYKKFGRFELNLRVFAGFNSHP